MNKGRHIMMYAQRGRTECTSSRVAPQDRSHILSQRSGWDRIFIISGGTEMFILSKRWRVRAEHQVIENGTVALPEERKKKDV